ncbi:DUF6011 domain-containing protein [Nonomuraea sp. NPDC049646]|uniref:DUF6011 domain-containing protein n=1 Tax=unclassified Nonomuraea TaxID=2593643 RepID=UPI0037A30FA5
MENSTTPHPIAANCLSCGRKLTAAASIAAGRGRTCQAKVRKAAIAADLTTYKPEQIAKAAELIDQNAIVPTSRDRLYAAVSSDGTTTYLVDQAAHTCTCKAGERGIRCYHLAAADVLAYVTRRAA